MAEILFFIAGTAAIAGAIGTVAMPNAFYSVLALVCHLLALAALFLLLRAEFVAAAQVVVYAGAVMVLYVFVVAYVGGGAEPIGVSAGRLRFLSPLFALALLVELFIAILGSGLSALETEGAPYEVKPGEPAFGSPNQVGEQFLTTYLLAFELASILLLVAAVGAVMLARRRRGLGDPREISVADLARGETGTLGDAEAGTMLEAGGAGGDPIS